MEVQSFDVLRVMESGMLGRRIVERVLAGAAVGTLMATAGCGAFFQCEGKASCTNSNTTKTVTGDFAYVTNTANGSTYIGQYNIASGSFVSIASAVSVPVVPGSMVVSPNNAFLYVAGLPSVGGVYLYTLSSTGALTIGNSSAVETGDLVGAMTISPDGNFLFTVDLSGTILKEYTLNKSTGAVAFTASATLPGTGCSFFTAAAGTPSAPTCAVTVSPNNDYVAVALSTMGVVIYPYSSSAGLTSTNYTTQINTAKAAYGVAFDSNDILYVAEATQVESFTGSAGKLITTVANGNTPVAITQTGAKYVYTANAGNGTISEYASSTGTLTSLGADVATATSVMSLGVDNTGKFLVTNGYNTSTGLQILSIASGGTLSTLSSAGTVATSTSQIPALVALSH